MSHEEPAGETIVQTAADAAEAHVFSHYDRSELRDYDVTVSYEDGQLEVAVYLEGPDEQELEAVVDGAASVAQKAVDELFEA